MSPSFTHRHAVDDRWVFWGFLGLLLWAPLPLASNRIWAIGILVVWVLLLFAGLCFAWRGRMAQVWSRLAMFRWPLFFLASFALLTQFQSLPLPAEAVEWLSPEAERIRAGASVLTGPSVHTVSIDEFQSSVYTALSVSFLLSFIIAVVLLRTEQRIDTLATVLVVSGLVQAILAVLLFSMGAQYQLFFTAINHVRALGSFVNPNHLAGYLELTLSVGIGLMLSRLGNTSSTKLHGWRDWAVASLKFLISPKMRLRLMLVIMVIALVLSRSRMGNTAFFAAMLIVGVMAISLSRRATPATVTLIASLVVVDIFIIGSWIGIEQVVHRVQETAVMASDKRTEQTVEARIEPARYSVDLIKSFPMLGSGGGSFYNVFSRYRPPQADTFYDHTHNDYVEIASDTGLIGAALLGGFVLVSLGRMVWVLRVRHSAFARGMAFGGLMASVALIIHSFVDFNLQIPANALTMTVILALGWCSAALPGSPSQSRNALQKSSGQ
ncbi:MAG: O-antigen ligase family protein [Hydrogenophilales bacterium]|nr:O-antigen ligase family protein [Hydrogenophilales bacterium]